MIVKNDSTTLVASSERTGQVVARRATPGGRGRWGPGGRARAGGARITRGQALRHVVWRVRPQPLVRGAAFHLARAVRLMGASLERTTQ